MQSLFFSKFVSAALFTGVLFIIALPAAAETEHAEENDNWQFKVEAYGWLPAIESTLPTGDEINLSLDDILDNLDFTFMGLIQARRDKWAIVSDLIFLKLSFDETVNRTIPVGPLDVPAQVDIGVDMKTWIVNLAGSYRIYQADKFDVQVLAGVRYLSLDVGASLDVDLFPGEKIVDGKDEVLDAIVGIRSLVQPSDKWWLSFRFDIGAGGSDLTWNTSAQLGRKFDWGSVAGGYRYTSYDFDSDFKLMKDLDVHGPFIGAAWSF